MRYRSLDLVKEGTSVFSGQTRKQVKFVDRTFNCSHARTLELWRFLRDHDNGVTNFHCEISADLLNEEELELLGTLRPGLLQLEIGVQTVNRDALAAIHRTAPFEKIAEHVNRVQGSHNVHQHLDLIAGLPYEDFESFRHSFDTVYALYPQELQLGFLKVLKGSEMYLRAQEYGIVYRSTPPYEVLQTRWITCGELLRLKEIEEMLEVYYNSLQYRIRCMRRKRCLHGRSSCMRHWRIIIKKKVLAGNRIPVCSGSRFCADFCTGKCKSRMFFRRSILMSCSRWIFI